MPIHPQARAVMERRANTGDPPLSADAPLEEKRVRFNNAWRERGPEVYRVVNRTIPGPCGDIPVRIYTPHGQGPYPVYMLFHGGGFVFGNLDTYDANARRICAGAGCMVVSVEYRLAPEHKFPTAPEDCYAATLWVADNAEMIGGDLSRMAAGGDSAGGNLATVVSMMVRDRGGPPLALQILVCPATHKNFQPNTCDRNETPRGSKDWWWWQYLRDESDSKNPYACPLEAQDLDGLPPALVITSEFDELRDEGEAYARRLEAAGVATTLTRYEGMFHVFHLYPGSIDKAREALEQQCSALRAAFA